MEQGEDYFVGQHLGADTFAERHSRQLSLLETCLSRLLATFVETLFKIVFYATFANTYLPVIILWAHTHTVVPEGVCTTTQRLGSMRGAGKHQPTSVRKGNNKTMIRTLLVGLRMAYAGCPRRQ